MSTQDPGIVRVAPSDLTFLWDSCRRCFWLKVKRVLRRPASAFPTIFRRIDAQTKDYFFDKGSKDLSPDLPPGQIVSGGLSVRSTPMAIAGHDLGLVIAGRMDTAIAFSDGTFGIVDFKTSDPKPEHLARYSRQLHAYAVAAENPAPGALRLEPVTHLGLFVVEPVSMVGLDDAVAYTAQPHYVALERDDDAFTAFLLGVLLVLEAPEPPEPSPDCAYCKYLTAGSLVLATRYFGGGS
jgi:hypothetical protein